MLGIPLLLVLWFSAALVAVARGILAARSGFRRRSLSLAVLPVLVLTAAVQPIAFVRFCCHVGDILHFEIMRPYYLAQVSEMPNGAPRLAVFNWGGMVWASTGVIYDESDEVALPAGRQSVAWQERANRTDLVCEGYGVEPMGGHFYLGYFPC